jgi:GRF zinc finger
MNCKVCKEPAIVRVSKSEKNNGKEFYSCPKGCQGWIGWADESQNVPREKKPFVQKPPATPMPNTSKTEKYINEDNEVGCKACGKTCMIKRSSSEKNYGKEYYACQDFCNIWNGWVEDEVIKVIEKQPKPQPVKQPNPQPVKKQPEVKKQKTSKKIFNMLPEEF